MGERRADGGERIDLLDWCFELAGAAGVSPDDHTIGEKVEIPIATATGVLARQTPYGSDDGGGYLLTLSNDLPHPQTVEIELPLAATSRGTKLIRRDGWMLWRVTVPANGRAELRYRA